MAKKATKKAKKSESPEPPQNAEKGGETPFVSRTGSDFEPRDIVTHQVAGEPSQLGIRVMDAPGPGGASHRYVVTAEKGEVIAEIKFQEGTVTDAGVNGVTMESLLAICMDRLVGFQNGDYSCYENGQAYENVTTSLAFLRQRTQDRINRRVEGTENK
jgi:hypothetical protein